MLALVSLFLVINFEMVGCAYDKRHTLLLLVCAVKIFIVPFFRVAFFHGIVHCLKLFRILYCLRTTSFIWIYLFCMQNHRFRLKRLVRFCRYISSSCLLSWEQIFWIRIFLIARNLVEIYDIQPWSNDSVRF